MTERPRVLRVGEEPPPLEPSRQAEPRKGEHRGRGKGSPPEAKASAAGRFALLNAFVDLAMRGLSRSEVAVWLVLFRDSRDGVAQTSQSDLASRAGCDSRSVRRALARLSGLSLVEVLHRGGINRGPSRYRVRCEPSLRTPASG